MLTFSDGAINAKMCQYLDTNDPRFICKCIQIIYIHFVAGWTNLHTSCPSLKRSFSPALQVGVRSARSLPIGEFDAGYTEYCK